MERAAVLDLVLKKRPYNEQVNPIITRPPVFHSTAFRADLVDVHPRTNGDVRIVMMIPYEDRHAAFSLTDAWGANLRVTVARAEDFIDGEADDTDRPSGAAGGVVDLSYQRNRAGRRPHLDPPDHGE